MLATRRCCLALPERPAGEDRTGRTRRGLDRERVDQFTAREFTRPRMSTHLQPLLAPHCCQLTPAVRPRARRGPPLRRRLTERSVRRQPIDWTGLHLVPVL